MPQPNDLSRSLVALVQESTLIAVIEMGQASWLVAGIVPGVNRHPLKKIATDQEELLQVLRRWAKEAETAGRMIKRIAVAYEAGRDGVWLARWLRARWVEAYVIHPSSVPVSREHRRAKTDRLDTELLKRAFLGWLRGEPDHCSMAAIPTLTEEDAKRPGRERESLVGERTRIINRIKGALARLGMRDFRPMLRNAPQLLASLRTPEGAALPPNTLAELWRDMARLSFVKQQIKEVETARLEQLRRAPGERGNAMVCRHAITPPREGQGRPAPRQWLPVAKARSGACGRVRQSWSYASRRVRLQFVSDTTWPACCLAGASGNPRRAAASHGVRGRCRIWRDHALVASCRSRPEPP